MSFKEFRKNLHVSLSATGFPASHLSFPPHGLFIELCFFQIKTIDAVRLLQKQTKRERLRDTRTIADKLALNSRRNFLKLF